MTPVGPIKTTEGEKIVKNWDEIHFIRSLWLSSSWFQVLRKGLPSILSRHIVLFKKFSVSFHYAQVPLK